MSFSSVADNFSTKLLHVRDEKNGVNGGTFTAGSFTARTLNTTLTNEISGASLASNQITLPAGTYFLSAYATAWRVQNNKLILKNITDSSTTLIGSSEFCETTVNNQFKAVIDGRFTIGASKTFELQHRCDSTYASEGYGTANGFGINEVYTDLRIWKVA